MEAIDGGTYLVILKIHCKAIHLWSQDRIQLLKNKTHSLKVSCLNVEQQSSNIRVSIIRDSNHFDGMTNGFHNNEEKSDIKSVENNNGQKSHFQEQNKSSGLVETSDLITFMTKPMDSSGKATFIIDLNIVVVPFNEDTNENIGQASVYLDHKFSTQGIHKTPITDGRHVQVGQLNINYLIVTNPIAFGKKRLKPDWMCASQLDAGHRGAGIGNRKDLPNELLENTIASFNFAHRHGADLCELDVILSADGVPIVYHDFDIDAVAAKQSHDDLGKSRCELNEFTLKQMRDLSLLSLNDENGSSYTVNIQNQDVKNRPFPTLAEVLEGVEGGLNIELKWPQLLESGVMQARKYCEINKFVEKVIEVIDMHERKADKKQQQLASHRPIVLSTFDVDLAILLRLKQHKYPVLFLTTGDVSRFNDPITKTVKNAIHFAEAFDLTGVCPNAAKVTDKLVKYAHDRGQIFYAWGKIESAQAIEELKKTGLNGVIYDKIDLIKPKSETSLSSSLP